ncbi:MAG: tRNA pseudouridine(13) synthase TruD, partial [Phycisphaerales bacterium]|nr:tRNA pseudouridine(13) synthase TruD [Phycisphaerales bacterium]
MNTINDQPDTADTAFGTGVDAPAFMTADIPGIGGVLKQRPEDFFVEEIPLYQPCGE